jgi:hypothetical protein
MNIYTIFVYITCPSKGKRQVHALKGPNETLVKEILWYLKKIIELCSFICPTLTYSQLALSDMLVMRECKRNLHLCIHVCVCVDRT